MQQYFTEEEFLLWDSDWHEQQLHDIENVVELLLAIVGGG